MTRYLDMVESPVHIKNLTIGQMEVLGEEIRQELITQLSKHGGHLGPNLGVVELTLALHKVFTTPKDKFVWDVSHQSYVHKLLTGRKDRFHSIRTTGGLCGFALRSESEHDSYGSGHAGTAISAALGMAVARDRRGTDEHVVCIFGDAALTNGISFEGLNNIVQNTKRFISILNDNEWSIAKNVGAIATYLNRLITHPRYNRLHKDLEKLLRRMPKGEIALKLAHKAQEGFKGALTEVGLTQVQDSDSDGRGGFGSSLIFEEMGLRYLGPIDGHDLPMLVNCLEHAKTSDQPIVLHVLTKKGKGYDVALAQPEKFHGTGPYDVVTGDSPPPAVGTPPSYQEVFGQAMVKLCRANDKLVAITAAMPSGTGLKPLEKALPGRLYDVGIAEEHAVLFAAGMATQGLHPVCAIYSTFMQRAYDCIVHDVALQDLPVILCMDRAGLSANDGPTHHGLFDISFLRPVPNLICMAPKDEDELVDMLYTATLQRHPVAIRYPRGNGEGVPVKANPVELPIGRAEILKSFGNGHTRKVALLALGNLVTVATAACARLTALGFDCAVVNARFTKPLDADTTETFSRAADVVVTLEDHVLAGGYGSLVLELLAEKRITTPVIRIGWPDQFIEHASSVEYLRQKYGLDAETVVARVCAEFGLQPAQPGALASALA